MEFQVSARKWRPQKFSQLIGQEHIIRTLKNAVELGRISHAYLFSGTRGVGKTTMARILAKALNCEHGPTPDPCDNCPVCQEIRDGSSIDVREIDGASNNGVAEVRDLIDNVQYATSSCRFKVYIIDEVHMLSKSAFNALLKTLEEPPEGVVFIFATTEAEKIPDTILSRCQCFEFKPLSHKQIIQQLALISEKEGIAVDTLSLEEIAKNGQGSMRDAQSLLDQVVAFSGKQVTAGSVEAVLGIAGQETLAAFIDAIRAGDFSSLLGRVQDTVNAGKDLSSICRDLAEYVRNLLVVKVAGENLLDAQTFDLEVLRRQAEGFHADELHQIFSLLSRTESEMKRSALSQQVFEMALLRLAEVRPFQHIDDMIRTLDEMADVAGEPAAAAEMPAAPAPPDAMPARPQVEDRAQTDDIPAPSPAASPEAWERVKAEVSGKKSVFMHYLESCRVLAFGDGELKLGFSEPYTRDLVDKEENRALLVQAVKDVTGREVKLVTSVIKGGKPPEDGHMEPEKKNPSSMNPLMSKSESEIIQQALDVFGGVLVR